MDKRKQKKEVINRKEIDPNCPVDKLVINVLHAHGIRQQGKDKEAVACQASIETIKLIRKDVFKSNPDILNDSRIVEAEIVDD